MSAIKDPKEIFPGKILYYVCGSTQNRPLTSDDITKEIVLSKPSYWYNDKPSDSKFFRIERTYKSYSGEMRTYCTHHSINDCGMGKHKYNLNRLFKTRTDAEQFIDELNSGVLSDLTDAAALERLEEFRQDIYDFDV